MADIDIATVGTQTPAAGDHVLGRKSGNLAWFAADGLGGGGATDPEVVRDTIAAALVAGANVTITPDDGADTITIAATGGGGATDPEVVRDTIAAALTAGSTRITITPNDAGDTITLDVPAASTTVVGAVELATNSEAQGLSLATRATTPANLGALVQPINAQTGTAYTVTAADFVGLIGKLVTLTNAAAITVTLPTPTSLGLTAGAQCDFAVLGAGMATFVAGSGATVRAAPSAVTKDQYSAVTATAIDGTTWLVVGRLA